MNYDGFILAGGRGSRMGALTDSTPKPLLKVKGRPMIEWILKRYHSAGFRRVFVAVRYLAAKISDRYGRAYEGMDIEYLVERDELGTAGSIGLLPEPLPLVVSNGDLYTSLDFAELLDYHLEQLVDATVCAVQKTLPFGAIGLGADVITERPSVSVNAGMYVLESRIVRAAMMASAHRQDMPDLINRVKLFGGKVGIYNLKPGAWADVGTPEDLERANA